MPAANITNGLNVADLSKFETSTTTGILKLIDGEKQYDGSSTTYSAWFEAVSSKLKGLGLTTFTSDVKGTTIDAYSNAQWNQSGGLRWNVKLIRLSKRDEVKQPQEVHANTKLTDIKVLRIGTYRTENYIAGTADIQCQQGIKTVSLTGLLMHYSTEVWDQLMELSKGSTDQRIGRQARINKYDWEEWIGITTGYEPSTTEYHVGYNTGEFAIERAKKLSPA